MTDGDRHLRATYGITEHEYNKMFSAQGGVCYICRRPPATRRLSVDHEHCRGFKKLPPDEKRGYIRGLLCFGCNRFRMAGKITIEEAKRIVEYLTNYELRRIKHIRPG